ncbi:hypothetical protein SLEP1_g54342 [Rubroshorea leprosula]|uniref:Reverse transcriptase zinc-binding domain-containing protein n=1 Tax=Rubroshorea leprosula TaxID=152421 RepID=A0AAV5MC32_9ROSI|nr:hypothetical protein SLEP1_g54342 [Rubroshorea leprosula]
MSLFLMPNWVVAKLISLQRSFLWGGVELKRKIPWVKWEYVCTSKRKGGLGVADLRRKNWALLGKWWYRLGDGVVGLWKQVVWEKYYGGRKEVDITAVDTVQVSRIWRDVISIGLRSSSLKKMLVNGFKWEVGDGSRVRFWREVWIGEKPLRELCPRLFELAVKKDGLVSEMGVWEEGGWRWNLDWRRGRLGREQDEELGFWESINRAQIKAGTDDCWHWVHGTDGKYVVKNAYDLLASTDLILSDHFCKLIWCKLVPDKVSFFGWRLCLDRLPTKWNLQKRGVVLEGGLGCGLCNEGIEDGNHVFCTCPEVWLIWVRVLAWWGMASVLPNIVGGVAEFFLFGLGRVIGKELASCIFLVTSWYVWFWRNCRVFKGNMIRRDDLVEMIQAKTFFWIKNYLQGCVFSLVDWKINPVEAAAAIRKNNTMLKEYRRNTNCRKD